MEYDIYEDFDNEEKILIFCLEAMRNIQIKNIRKFQELFYVISNTEKFKEKFGDIYEFEEYSFGFYSEKLANVFNSLYKLGIVNINYKLTEKGVDVYNLLKTKDNNNTAGLIKEVVDFVIKTSLKTQKIQKEFKG